MCGDLMREANLNNYDFIQNCRPGKLRLLLTLATLQEALGKGVQGAGGTTGLGTRLPPMNCLFLVGFLLAQLLAGMLHVLLITSYPLHSSRMPRDTCMLLAQGAG